MSEFDRGVRASIVAHDMFYGVGQAIGLGLDQHRLGRAALINELRVENGNLRAHLNNVLDNAETLREYINVVEIDRDHANNAFKQRTAEYNELVEAYNRLLQQKNEWVLYAERLVKALTQERL